MTRSGVKACLFAWSATARRLNALCGRVKRLEDKLSIFPMPSAAAPVDTPEVKCGERVGAVLPHGNQTSDPTATAATQRAGISQEVEQINSEIVARSAFYFDVIRVLVNELTHEQATIIYGYYANPYPHARNALIRSYSNSERTFYQKLREAVTALQYADCLPPIPDDLQKEPHHEEPPNRE